MSKIIENLTIVIHPFIPHLSEEIWHGMGKEDLCVLAKWPETEQFFEDSVIRMPIQINGKIKDMIEFEHSVTKDQILKRIENIPKIQNIILGKEVYRVIYINNKIINLLIK